MDIEFVPSSPHLFIQRIMLHNNASISGGKISCPCGSLILASKLKKHITTKKHKIFEANMEGEKALKEEKIEEKENGLQVGKKNNN